MVLPEYCSGQSVCRQEKTQPRTKRRTNPPTESSTDQPKQPPRATAVQKHAQQQTNALVRTCTSPDRAGRAEKTNTMNQKKNGAQARQHSPTYETTQPPTQQHTDQPVHPPNKPFTMRYSLQQYVQKQTDAIGLYSCSTRDGISIVLRFSATPGREQAVPGRAASPAPRSPSSASAPVLSPGTPRTDVWGDRGTVVVAPAVWCRTIEPTRNGAC